MIADRSLERRFRDGFTVGFKEGLAEGFKEGYAQGRTDGLAEQCRSLRQILDHPPAELPPELRDGLARALAERENAPIPAYSGRGCCRPGN